MRPPEAFLFDMDGTLCNTEPLHLAAYLHVLGESGRTIDPEAFGHQYAGQTTQAVITDPFPDLVAEDRARLVARKEALFRDNSGGLVPLPGVVTYLNALKASGAGLALVTNAPRADVDCVLKVLGLDSYFPVIVIASDLPHPKPHPLPYVRALHELDVTPANAIVFEDSVAGVHSARGAGIKTVGITTTLMADELTTAGASFAIADFRDGALAMAGLLPSQIALSDGRHAT